MDLGPSISKVVRIEQGSCGVDVRIVIVLGVVEEVWGAYGVEGWLEVCGQVACVSCLEGERSGADDVDMPPICG